MNESRSPARASRFWHRTGAESELMRLSSGQCDGTATEADCRRLDSLLTEPDALTGYLDIMEQHATFLWRQRWRQGAGLPPFTDETHPGDAPPRTVRDTRATRASNRKQPAAQWRGAAMVALDGIRFLLGWLAKPATASFLIAGIFLASVLGLVAFTSLDSQNDRDQANADAFASGRLPVAFVAALHEATWPANKQPYRAWQGLRVGDTIELASGLVELSFVSGAKVVLEGPARFEATAQDGCRLHAGRLTAEVKPDGAAAMAPAGLFRVTTANAVVTDLGTEFGVAFDTGGETLVRVFEGRVELAAGDGVSVTPQEPLHLAVGHAAGVAIDGRLAMRSPVAFPRFVRSLPKPEPEGPPESFLARIGWDDAAAETLVRDAFDGSGSLAGSTPAARGGVGAAGWIAPSEAWELRDGSLHANAAGSALVPFRPEPGWLYRLTVTLDVVAGGEDWCALGFRAGADPAADHLTDGGIAWMLQRHSTATEGSHVFAGPGLATKLTEGDRRTGRQTRSIVFDTTGPRWRAHFLLADEPVATYGYPSPPTEISHVGVSVYRGAQARIDSFSLERAPKRLRDASTKRE